MMLITWYNDMEKFTPGNITAHAKYSFILTAFGLQYLAPLLFKMPGANMETPPYYSKLLNTPMWDAVRLSDPDDGQTTIFLEVALVDAILPKVIKETPVQGRNGTVKEYIATGDWQINIKGAVFGEEKNAYPLTEIATLTKLAKLRKQVAIESKLINHLDVTNVVIKNLSWRQLTGCMNKISFEISCVSDEPFELQQKR